MVFSGTLMTLRIVQLTDLHLSPQFGDKRWRALEALLNDLPMLAGPLDRVVLTGDIATHGQKAVYAALRERLTPWHSKLRLVPGNHDNSPALREVFHDRVREDAPRTNFLEDLEGVRLVGLDSSRPWRVSGALGHAQLAWLEEALAPQTPSLIFLHHPPLPIGTWWLDKDLLRDRAAFTQLAQAHAVLGVFCGHVHQEAAGRLGAVRVWTTPSTAYQFKPGSLIPRTEPKAAAVRLIEVSAHKVDTSIIYSPHA